MLIAMGHRIVETKDPPLVIDVRGLARGSLGAAALGQSQTGDPPPYGGDTNPSWRIVPVTITPTVPLTDTALTIVGPLAPARAAWQCPGCQRWQAPHSDRCDCQPGTGV